MNSNDMNQTETFEHFYLREWPFQIVPDDGSSSMWADRSELLEKIDRLIWRWTRSPKSSIHLMWADLGTGKTHTLKYIQNTLKTQPNSKNVY